MRQPHRVALRLRPRGCMRVRTGRARPSAREARGGPPWARTRRMASAARTVPFSSSIAADRAGWRGGRIFVSSPVGMWSDICLAQWRASSATCTAPVMPQSSFCSALAIC